MRKKISNRAFTLVELLAVIIILGVIALITIPQVLDFIEESKEESMKLSAENYIKGVKNAVMEERLTRKFIPTHCIVKQNGNILCNDETTEIKVNVSGNKPTYGNIYFENGEVVKYNLIINKYFLINDGYEIACIPDISEPVSFADDSWRTIAANVKAGNLSAYKVGDTKEVAITGYTNGEANSNGLYTVRIANTKTPKECNQAGFSQSACGFVIEFVDIITTHNMNPSGTYKGVTYDYGWNKDGWPASDMYKFLNDTTDETITSIYEGLPEDLQKVIEPTQVVSSHGSSDSTNFTSTDKLYLLSTKEVWGKEGTSNVVSNDTAEAETRQLDYYKDYKNSNGSIGVTTTNPSGAIKKYNGSVYRWWLRSAYSYATNGFYGVGSYGNWHSYGAYDTCGVAAAFRIG